MNNFDPTKYGATPVGGTQNNSSGGFNPLNFGATPLMDNSQTSTALSHTNYIREKKWNEMNQQEQQAKITAESERIKKEGGFGKNFMSALGKNLATSFLDPAAKFVGSGILAPMDIARGQFGKQPLSTEFTLPSGEKSQTFQSEYGTKIGTDIAEGKDGLQTASDITGAVGNIAGGAADVLGIGKALTSKPVKKLGDIVNKFGEQRALKSLSKEALDVVTPSMTKLETEKALAQGRGTGGGLFSKTKITPDKRTIEVAENVKGIVSKNNSGAQNIQNVKNALSKEAQNLRAQIKPVDKAYSLDDLNKALSNVEEPISLRGTPFEKQIKPIKEAAIKIAQKKGDMISDLLDARTEFDNLVEKTYPNLYDKESAPMRNAITSIRDEINKFIENNLPEGVKYSESLRKQTLYYDAIDNIAGKSALETKSTGLGRFTKKFLKNPLVNGIIGGTAAYEGLKRYSGQ